MLKAQFFIKKTNLYVHFWGELDQKSIEKVKVKTSELITNYKIEYLIINCKNLSFMDSSGIGFIIGRYNQLKINDGKIIICEMNDLIKRIVTISGLSRILICKNTEEEANQVVEEMYEQVHKLRI